MVVRAAETIDRPVHVWSIAVGWQSSDDQPSLPTQGYPEPDLAIQEVAKLPRGARPTIKADLQDYAVARNYLLRSMVFSDIGLGKATRRFFMRLQNRYSADAGQGGTFTVPELVETDEEISDSKTINKHLADLVDARMVDKTERSKGKKPAKYRLAQNLPDEATLAGLPDPRLLAASATARGPTTP